MINFIKQVFAFIKSWFFALSFWKKMLVKSLLSSFVGATFVGFLNKYAVYYYAYKQGIRLPIEGVEYLDLAVSLISFVFIFNLFIGTIIIYNTLIFFKKKLLKAIERKKRKEKLYEKIFLNFKDKYGTVLTLLVLLSFLILFIALLVIAFVYFLKFLFFEVLDQGYFFRFIIKMRDFFKELETNESFVYWAEIFFLPFLFLILLLYILAMLFPSKIKNTTIGLVILIVFFITTSLFDQEFYKSFLRIIKYGGELPIELEYRKADNTAAQLNGYLILRTKKNIAIKNSTSSNIEEVSIDRISKITFLNGSNFRNFK